MHAEHQHHHHHHPHDHHHHHHHRHHGDGHGRHAPGRQQFFSYKEEPLGTLPRKPPSKAKPCTQADGEASQSLALHESEAEKLEVEGDPCEKSREASSNDDSLTEDVSEQDRGVFRV